MDWQSVLARPQAGSLCHFPSDWNPGTFWRNFPRIKKRPVWGRHRVVSVSLSDGAGWVFCYPFGRWLQQPSVQMFTWGDTIGFGMFILGIGTATGAAVSSTCSGAGFDLRRRRLVLV